MLFFFLVFVFFFFPFFSIVRKKKKTNENCNDSRRRWKRRVVRSEEGAAMNDAESRRVTPEFRNRRKWRDEFYRNELIRSKLLFQQEAKTG